MIQEESKPDIKKRKKFSKLKNTKAETGVNTPGKKRFATKIIRIPTIQGVRKSESRSLAGRRGALAQCTRFWVNSHASAGIMR